MKKPIELKIDDAFWKDRSIHRIEHMRLLEQSQVCLNDISFWKSMVILMDFLMVIPLVALSMFEYCGVLYPHAVSHAVSTSLFLFSIRALCNLAESTAYTKYFDTTFTIDMKMVKASIKVSEYLDVPLKEMLETALTEAASLEKKVNNLV